LAARAVRQHGVLSLDPVARLWTARTVLLDAGAPRRQRLHERVPQAVRDRLVVSKTAIRVDVEREIAARDRLPKGAPLLDGVRYGHLRRSARLRRHVDRRAVVEAPERLHQITAREMLADDADVAQGVGIDPAGPHGFDWSHA